MPAPSCESSRSACRPQGPGSGAVKPAVLAEDELELLLEEEELELLLGKDAPRNAGGCGEADGATGADGASADASRDEELARWGRGAV